MKRLWFGGSFNPIHSGHLICARAVAEAGGFDRVVLVPSGQPPHKAGDISMADPLHRLTMCKLAITHDSFFDVDAIEIQRSGPSYTLQTVHELKRGGAEKVSWLIGADMALFLPRWHEPIQLMAAADLVLMARPGWSIDWATLPLEFQHLQRNVVTAPLLEISSTQIRERLALGKSVRYMTPDPVLQYIDRHLLYR